MAGQGERQFFCPSEAALVQTCLCQADLSQGLEQRSVGAGGGQTPERGEPFLRYPPHQFMLHNPIGTPGGYIRWYGNTKTLHTGQKKKEKKAGKRRTMPLLALPARGKQPEFPAHCIVTKTVI